MTIPAWEYKVDIGVTSGGKPDPNSLKHRLKENGEVGWELVYVFSYTTHNEREDWYIYKRPLVKNTVNRNNRKK